MSIRLSREITADFGRSSQREWLEANGLGGWAASSLSGAHTRRYHGLLVAAVEPPVGRMVLLSRLDETIQVGEQSYELGCSQYPGALHPRGFERLESFELDLFPVFEYRAGGCLLRKTIAARQGENTTLVLYRAEGEQEFTLHLQPFVAARDYHSLTRANPSIRPQADFREGVWRVEPYEGLPELYISVPGARYQANPLWYYNFEYAIEKFRGLDYQEDLFSHGTFSLRMKPGQQLGIIISTQDPAGRDAFEIYWQESERRRALTAVPGLEDGLRRRLTLAADQFLVQRGRDLRTVIAGYHWFTDWGRDTMIALPGLCLSTGRCDEARRILTAFAQEVDQGMLPNRFTDQGGRPEYNTADATLWFFVAIHHYWKAVGDQEGIRNTFLPVLRSILEWHRRGTRYNIRMDEDGLLSAGEPGVQLTWMDAKVGDWVVTPRQGKAVEINALWYNALRIYAELCGGLGDQAQAQEYSSLAERVRERFEEVFWNEEKGCLYDVIEGERRDDSLRPNQIFALSLPFPLLDGPKARQVLQTVWERLYTPRGLRTLSADNPDYRGRYGGSPWERDGAYHQGTVWPWLLGPLVSATLRIQGANARKKLAALFEDFRPHLEEACIGTVSEIFEGDPPHAPRGAAAQAWSVAELLRSYLELREKASGVRGEALGADAEPEFRSLIPILKPDA